MKAIFLALILLIISTTQALSTTDFNTSSMQKDGLAQEFVGKVYENGSTKNYTRLNNKDMLVASENEHKHEPSVTIRKGGGGGGRGGGGGGGGRGGGGGFGGGRRGGGGLFGGFGHHHHHHHNAAPSLFPETHFWVPKFILYVSFTLITLFPFN